MPLNYPDDWKFEGVGVGISDSAIGKFMELILEIADGSKDVLETFKKSFGDKVLSNSFEFAVHDVERAMRPHTSNAAVFIERFWTGVEAAKTLGAKVPSPRFINEFLGKHQIPLRLEPPQLVMISGDAVIIDGGGNVAASSGPSTSLFVTGETIGAGGYGVVYKASRATAISEFEYALKVLDPSPFVSDYAGAIRRFQREVRALQSLQHRAIIPYYEAGLTTDKKPYVVMPLIRGKNLRSAAQDMNLAQILLMFSEISGGLQYAHANKVLHRDLKPSNILVRDSDQQPIILDFGSAYLLDYLDSQSLTTHVVGTLGYIPHEVFANPKVRSPQQDIYACGIMLYECIAGHRPDPNNYSPLADVDSKYRTLDQVITAAIAPVTERTATIEEFHTQIEGLQRVVGGAININDVGQQSGQTELALASPSDPSRARAEGLNIDVFLVQNIGAGATPGSHIRAVSNTPFTIVGVRLVVTNLLVWNEKIAGFVTHPDIHGQDKDFPQEIELQHRNTLHPGTPADFGFIRAEANSLVISSTSRDYRTSKSGTWQLSYRIGPDDKSFIAGTLCFEWSSDSPGSVKPCECPGAIASPRP